MFDTEREPVFEEDAALPVEAPDAPAAVEAAPEQSGQPRDEKGRFASAPPEEPETPEGAVAPPPETAEPTEQIPPVEEEPDEPFTYRADGQDWEIPGSAVGEDGVFIPILAARELQQLLSEGRAARGSVRQRLSESSVREQSAMRRAEAAEANVKHVLGHFEQLVESGRLGEWLTNIAQNWPILKAEAKANALQIAQAAEREELERFRASERQNALRPIMEQTLERYVGQFGQEYGLDDDQMAALYDRMNSEEYRSVVWVSAPGDDPMAGFRKGDTVINWGPIRDAAALMSVGRRPQTAIQKAMNENKAQQTTKAVPPTVGGKGVKAPRPGPKMPSFATAKEADDWFNKGGYNDLEIPEE